MLKHKNFIKILFVILLAGQLFLFFEVPVSANHNSCDDTSPQSFLHCKDSRRITAQESCFNNNAGNNGAIESCVGGVTAHFDHTGAGSDPPLPAGALPKGSSASKVIEGADCKKEDLRADNCAIIRRLNQFINVLSVLVGIVVTIMIIFGGIQYTAAGEDPGAVAKAKKHISQAILALVGYGLVFAFLQYIIPGGL